MTEATLRIPGNLDINKISDEIIYKALSIAIEKKKKEIQKELKHIDSKIKRFEKKYKSNLTDYEKSMSDGFQHHNDWMNWSLLIETKNHLLEEFQNFNVH